MGGANTDLGWNLDRGGARLPVRQVDRANTDLEWSLGRGLALFLDRQVGEATQTSGWSLDGEAGQSQHGCLGGAKNDRWQDL